ncbi:2-keto-4-pentenoate hydratase [uncultured Chloroflexus sp.]|uniref:2-keto-4-pentenoate hydratase n=1 Tax=uncultured Chloroflexus sp. TaxID=214040 RepID=UPI0026138A0C|nr:fumarylacetoacetate hydrolase family protein [uncultured Chloroflexus sp.]
MTLTSIETELAQTIGDARAMRRMIVGNRLDWGVDLNGAYRIQQARFANEICIGYKLGLISPAKQQQMGLEQPIYGRITPSMIGDQVVQLGNFVQPRLEPELVVVLRRSIPATAEPGAVACAIGGFFIGVDILDSVWRDYRFSAVEVIADNASSGGFLLGARLHERVPDGELRLYLNGELRTAGSIAALGHLEQQLCWLARNVDGLAAGQIIFLGSPAQAVPATTGVLEVTVGDDIIQAYLAGEE